MIPLTARNPGRLNRYPFIGDTAVADPFRLSYAMPAPSTPTLPQPPRSCHVSALADGTVSAHNLTYPFIIIYPNRNGFNSSTAALNRSQVDNAISWYRAEEWIAENASTVVHMHVRAPASDYPPTSRYSLQKELAEDAHRDVARASSPDSSTTMGDSSSDISMSSSYWDEEHDNSPTVDFPPSIAHGTYPDTYQMSMTACRALVDELQASSDEVLDGLQARGLLDELRAGGWLDELWARRAARSSSPCSSDSSSTMGDLDELHSRRNSIAEGERDLAGQ
jgi:hypothetical protein